MAKIITYRYLYKNLFLCFIFFFIFSIRLFSKDENNKADSIILKVLESRDYYGRCIEEYDAIAYIKGDKNVKKKNMLYQYAPDFLYLDKKGKNTFIESVVNIHFKSPNHFDRQMIAFNGSQISISDIRKRTMQFLNVNIYNQAIFNNRILIPGIKDIFNHYRFEYVAENDTLGHRIHQIRVIPKIRNQQLISGFLYVTDSLWSIYQINIEGKWELSNYRIETEFGLPEKNFLLPIKSVITFHLKLLGNEVINRYYSFFQYKNVKNRDSILREKAINYEYKDYFNVLIDSGAFEKDEQFWEANRPVPLTTYEKSLLEIRAAKPPTKDKYRLLEKSMDFFSQGFVSSKRFKYNDSQMSYSGLINPFKLSYSKLDGIVYWQEFRYKKINDEGQEFFFSPSLGFLFKEKQIYFTVPVQWLFQPRRMGEIRLTLQNRNQAYNSAFIDMIEQAIPDSIHFSDFNLKYYHHYSSGIEGQYEITNGLLLHGGINYDWYLPVKYKNKKESAIHNETEINGDVSDLITDRYQIFLPTVGFTWTPRPFLRIAGTKKEYMGSVFPTLSIEFSRGVKGFWGSNSNYTQLEADIQQKIPIGLMNTFQYYVSAGKFLKTNSLYFADFNLFQKRNFPKSWNEPIGGVFQLLRREWYNASRSYAQAHLIYEFPYLLSRLIKNVSEDILSERIYVSQLYTPILPCYTEIGYGIGNVIGDAGVFVSFVKGKYDSIGATFTLGLGK